MKTILLLLLIPFATYCQPCDKLPKHFINWETAITTITHAKFSTKDFADCNKSSWIKSAQYYSCDDKIGYLLMITKDKKNYLHKDVPLQLWKQFKAASSFGSFYNKYLKHKYQFYLN